MTRARRGLNDQDIAESRISLLEHERVDLAVAEQRPPASDEELNKKYVQGAIRIVTETARYSLAGILQMLQEKVVPDNGGSPVFRYQLDPEYQRRHRWGVVRKSRLIESFLMNVPVPPVFLYERDLARFEVMDGRQRLTALSEFYDNKFALTDLQYWPELNGRFYNQLPSKVRDGIDRRYISSIILLQETASTPEQATLLKKMVFERLNSGGVALSSQETRNAVYNGPLNALCLALSANGTFRAMWGIPSDPLAADEEEVEPEEEREESTNKGKRMFERMEDVELVLRFFAYRQIENFPGGLNKISAYLDRFLIEGNKFPTSVLAEYRQMFEDTVSLLREILGLQPFNRLAEDGSPKGKPTKIVYDPIMYVASRYRSGEARERLLGRKDRLLLELGRMYRDSAELFSGRRTNTPDTQARNVCMTRAFRAALEEAEGGGVE